MSDKQNVDILPLWGEATLLHVLAPSIPDAQERMDILRMIRDARLLEVDQIERAMGISPRTSEIRRQYKYMMRKRDE